MLAHKTSFTAFLSSDVLLIKYWLSPSITFFPTPLTFPSLLYPLLLSLLFFSSVPKFLCQAEMVTSLLITNVPQLQRLMGEETVYFLPSSFLFFLPSLLPPFLPFLPPFFTFFLFSFLPSFSVFALLFHCFQSSFLHYDNIQQFASSFTKLLILFFHHIPFLGRNNNP